MTGTNTIDPISILKGMEDRCRKSATGLPQKVEQGNEWSGIVFRLGNNRMLVPLDEVVEILTYPDLTVVPNTFPWVLGIANIRGKLLPVVDMNGYLNDSITQVKYRSRVLVVDWRGVFSGLVVDEVMGLRHFHEDALVQESSDIEEYLQPYVSHGYMAEGQYWGVFSLFALVESSQFIKTAV
jgi:twitching motility protein PilI